MTTIKSCHTLLNKPKIRQEYESLHREKYPSKQVQHIMQPKLKKKLNDEFNVRFDSKNIDILRAINALNAGSDTYLDLSELDMLY